MTFKFSDNPTFFLVISRPKDDYSAAPVLHGEFKTWKEASDFIESQPSGLERIFKINEWTKVR